MRVRRAGVDHRVRLNGKCRAVLPIGPTNPRWNRSLFMTGTDCFRIKISDHRTSKDSLDHRSIQRSATHLQSAQSSDSDRKKQAIHLFRQPQWSPSSTSPQIQQRSGSVRLSRSITPTQCWTSFANGLTAPASNFRKFCWNKSASLRRYFRMPHCRPMHHWAKVFPKGRHCIPLARQSRTTGLYALFVLPTIHREWHR